MNVTISKIFAVVAILIVLGIVLNVVIKDDAGQTKSGSTPPESTSVSNSDQTSVEPLGLFPPSKQILAPDFTLKSADGHVVSLSKAVTHGPVLLDFWASYCGPCRMELPEYEQEYKTYGPKGVQFYTINSSDQTSTIRGIAESSGLTMPMLTDPDGAVSGAYGVDAIPVTLVIDHNRMCVAACVGYSEYAIKQTLPETLDKLLSAKS